MADSRNNGPGTGEERARRRSRRATLVSVGLAIAGLGLGIAASRTRLGPTIGGSDLSTGWAAAGVVAILVVLGFTIWWLRNGIDEIERQKHFVGVAIGAYGYMAGYPIWFVLWKGGLTTEPDHQILFTAFLAISFAAMAWQKLSR